MSFCDNCGIKLSGKKFIPIETLQEDIYSANVGESAIVCLNCAARLGEYSVVRYDNPPSMREGWEEIFEGHQNEAEQEAKEANIRGDEVIIFERWSSYKPEPIYHVYTRKIK